MISEAKIVINGCTLSEAQTLTLRVAVSDMCDRMSRPGALGADGQGEATRLGYWKAASQIQDLIFGEDARWMTP